MNIKLSYEDACKIIDSGLNKFIASIDGVSQQSYEIYRKNGKFSLVLDNIKLLAEAKRKLNSKTPHMHWQFLVFKHFRDFSDVFGIVSDTFHISDHLQG